MKQYAITMGFDTYANDKLQTVINSIAKVTQNNYMISNGIEPHITIGSFYSENDKLLIELLSAIVKNIKPSQLSFECVDSFYPFVVFAYPKKNKFLSGYNKMINECMIKHFPVADNCNYTPEYWMPHCTLATKLSENENVIALNEANKIEFPFTATIEKISLVECNPYKKLIEWNI